MLGLYKNDEGYFTVQGMSVKEWLKYQGNEMPDDILAIIDDDNPLFERITEAARFKPVVENGELIDIEELPPLQSEPTPEQIIEANLVNLENDDYKVIKNSEIIAIFLKEKFGLELPYDPVEVHKEKQAFRDIIEKEEKKSEEEL